MKLIKCAMLVGAGAVLAAGLHYALPQVDTVYAVGIETKRVDEVTPNGEKKTTDVYFVQTERVDTAKPNVYRNEDNLLYLKWNSADTQAKVQSLAKDKQLVAVRHYGWRIRLLSMFPNALDVWAVDEDYRHIPVFNIIVLSLLGLSGLIFYRRIGALGTRLSDRRERRATARSERSAAARSDRQGRSDSSADLSDFFASDSSDGGQSSSSDDSSD